MNKLADRPTCVQTKNKLTDIIYVTSQKWLCFSGTLEKVTYPGYTCTVAYTGKVTFYKILEKTRPCLLVTLYYRLLPGEADPPGLDLPRPGSRCLSGHSVILRYIRL